MFDELIREVEKLGKTHTFSISVSLDDKGYYDRVCPNEKCTGAFKVFFEDWKDKVRDEEVFCPFCRHAAPSDEWHSSEQVEHLQEAAQAEAARLFQTAIKKGVDRSRPMKFGGGLISMSMSLSYTPGRIPSVVPPDASDVLRQEFVCEICACRYASLGASFFCPACGHNSVTSSFDTTLVTVERTVRALPALRSSLEQTTDLDTACNATRQILEDQFPRLVGAFERLSAALFDRLPNSANHPRKGSVFQRVGDASGLWLAATGKGYGDFLSPSELARMNVLFQRRHVLSHGQGIVDQTYLDRTADATYGVGQRLVVHDEDVLELTALIGKLTQGLRGLVP
jgi:uncharacterized Zn finger protein (UPF0148 family)